MEATQSSIPLDVLLLFSSGTAKRQFPAGTVLMRQEGVGDCMHVIVSGRVRVEREEPDIKGPILLSELGPGDVVGEIGVVMGSGRTATVTAIEDTETVEFRARRRPSWKPLPVSREIAAPILDVAGHRLHLIRLVAEAVRRQQAHSEDRGTQGAA